MFLFRRRNAKITPLPKELVNLEDQVKKWKCPICYSKSKTICIPYLCGHGVCFDCLSSLVNFSNGNILLMKCSICNSNLLPFIEEKTKISRKKICNHIILGLNERKQYYLSVASLGETWNLYLDS